MQEPGTAPGVTESALRVVPRLVGAKRGLLTAHCAREMQRRGRRSYRLTLGMLDIQHAVDCEPD